MEDPKNTDNAAAYHGKGWLVKQLSLDKRATMISLLALSFLIISADQGPTVLLTASTVASH